MSLLEQHETLREMAFRYARAIDNCDAESLIRLFTSDGSIGGMDPNIAAFKGADDLRKMIRQVSNSFVKTLHKVFNQTFELTDGAKTATGETYCTASHIVAQPDGSWQVLDMDIRYHNEYVREEGVWKFKRRRLEVMWLETRPAQKFSPAMLSKDPEHLI